MSQNNEKDMMNLLKNIIENIDEGIHVIDKEGKTILYNKTMSQLEEMDKLDILDKSFKDVSKNMNIKNSTLLKVLKNKTPILNNIQTYSNKTGKEIVTINTTQPIILEGKFYGVLEKARDMTQVKVLSDQLFKLNEKKNKQQTIKHIKKIGYTFEDIIGKSECMVKTIDMAKKASTNNATVFIYGETGTGKELISQAIHYESNRKNKPFIAQNCAALPETLLEGILFGTVKGGFTGAIDRPGLFEQANGGTLLLDEINSMPIQLQSKLLRVLQEGYVRRIGGNEDILVDVRIIATTNESPSEILSQGKIRKDLYYRLNVINIKVPSLRERGRDIVLLGEKFIQKYNSKLEKEIDKFSNNAIEKLIAYPWYGNVRELENTIYSAMSMMDDEDTIYSNMLNIEEIEREDRRGFSIDIESKPLDWIIADIEERCIIEALERADDNVTKAGAILGLSRQNLQYKMKKYNIKGSRQFYSRNR